MGIHGFGTQGAPEDLPDPGMEPSSPVLAGGEKPEISLYFPFKGQL